MVSLLTDVAQKIGLHTFVLLTYFLSIICAMLLAGLVVQSKFQRKVLQRLKKIYQKVIVIEYYVARQDVRDVPDTYEFEDEKRQEEQRASIHDLIKELEIDDED